MCAWAVVLCSKGVHGATQLGDLVSVITSYDTTAGYSSNGVSKYFSHVAGVDNVNQLVQGVRRDSVLVAGVDVYTTT